MKRRKFISLTSKSAVVVTGVSPLLSWACNENNLSDSLLKEQALLAFKRFEEVWDFQDFWKRGNTFDACLVFVDALQQRWPNDEKVIEIQEKVGVMLEANLDFFNSYDPGTLWADDFGWWGLMALNARKHLFKIGNNVLADKYLKLSTDLCWEYKKNTAYDHSENGNPVLHGCRNGDANGDSLGVKNTVTNVLLFLLSSRIYRLSLTENIGDNEKYLDMAYQQWVWFNKWFELEEYQFLKLLSSSGALVQERPMAFVEGSTYQEKIHPPWAEGWVWAGDQGMLVAALTDMLAIKSELAEYLISSGIDTSFDVQTYESRLRDLIKLIALGVKNAMVSDIDGIIREAPCYSSFGPEHGRDYLSGRGILMRYLGSKEERDLLDVDLSENIEKTVNAIWITRDKSTNQVQPEFTSLENDKVYVEQFRALWGIADDVHKWDIDTMIEKNKYGVCQSVGLDMIGAMLKLT
ncbi:glycoside hydrolase family 76 protein [Maribacter sp. Hel_I_7]|uniref:glycoside hydrolase family 76 protein n=1 Tax=Maribacter sp. Hel_I_7 TaxID=1249997 RepID=UPI000479B2D7|nr:glycoside hydrolase family 76 protein [Maribacter sp. Hel_I_7]